MHIIEAIDSNNIVYHFTYDVFLEKILSENRLIPHQTTKTIDGKTLTGVSVTRDKNFYMNDENVVIFILDREKLNSNYKIIPYNGTRKINYKTSHMKYRQNSEEIVISSSGITNLKKYVKKLILPSHSVTGINIDQILEDNPEWKSLAVYK